MIKNILMCGMVAFVLTGCGKSGSSVGLNGDKTNDKSAAEDTTNSFPSVGRPDLDSFSLSVEEGVNMWALNYDGATKKINVRVADNLNNNSAAKAFDGLVIKFTTEYGRIEESCTIQSGSCSVTFNSQSPRPADGRVTILAYTEGTESFKDVNTNGLFDEGDLFNDKINGNPVYYRRDLSEPFRNDNKHTYKPCSSFAKYYGSCTSSNSVRDVGDAQTEGEVFFDVAGFTEGKFDGPDGKFSGTKCAHPTLCSDVQSVLIWDDLELVLSDDTVSIVPYDLGSTCPTSANAIITSGTKITGSIPSNRCVRLDITDGNGNVLSAGTKVTIEVAGNKVIEETVGSAGFPKPYVIRSGASNTTVKIGVNVKSPPGRTAELKRELIIPVP